MKLKNKPAISVVVPAYNEEKLIGRCLDSLFSQDFNKPYEVIVINNNSTDGTTKIASKYKVKIINELQKGVIFAKQKGLISAQSEIVAFLDADSQACSGWLQEIHNVLEDRRFIAVTGPYTNTDGPEFHKKYVSFFQSIVYFSYKNFRKNLYLAGGNFACRKNIIDLFGGFDISIGPGSDEYGVLTRLKEYGLVYFSPRMKTTTSGRRSKGGLFSFINQMFFSYGFNYISSLLVGRTIFPPYKDIR